MEQPVRLTARVEGAVQAVGFRAWTRSRAVALGLDGSARNLDDGAVELVAQGPRAACEHLLAALDGPDAPGRVARVRATWEPAQEGVRGFRTR